MRCGVACEECIFESFAFACVMRWWYSFFLIRSFRIGEGYRPGSGGGWRGRCTQYSTRIIPAAWTADYFSLVPLYIMDLGQMQIVTLITISYCLYLHTQLFFTLYLILDLGRFKFRTDEGRALGNSMALPIGKRSLDYIHRCSQCSCGRAVTFIAGHSHHSCGCRYIVL